MSRRPPAGLTQDNIADVLAQLPVLELLPAAAVCGLWARASNRPRAWSRCVITAHSLSAIDRPAAPNNILAFGEAALWSVARKLRHVAELHELPSCPRHAAELPAAHRSPMHLRRAELWPSGPVFRWLQYNTDDFGWFYGDHLTSVPCGLKVWAPALAMCRYFAAGPGAAAIMGRDCVEVGCGVGVLSTVLAASGARRVLVTDIDAGCLRIAGLNGRLNEASRLRVARLRYGSTDAGPFRDAYGRFDMMFGADVVYSEQVVAPLFETAEELLAAGGRFVLGFVPRGDALRELLERTAAVAGFGFAPPAREFLRPADPQPGLSGGLAELQEMLRRMPSVGSHLHESEDLVELYTFYRDADKSARLDLDTLD